VDIDDGVRVGDLAQGVLRILGEAAHAALDDAPVAVLIEHSLEDLIVAAVELVLAVDAQELHARVAGDVVEVVVLGDEAAAQVQGANEAQGALPGAAAADEDDRGVRAEQALIRRRRGDGGVFDGHFEFPGTFREGSRAEWCAGGLAGQGQNKLWQQSWHPSAWARSAVLLGTTK